MDLAPIVLFVYNRPRHTHQTIEALKKNVLATESELFIFSDAPKTAQDAEAVQQVRDYIQAVEGFKELKIILREINWGLANSIVEGVTSLVNEYGKVIVLEDDLVTGPYFLKFMNDGLDYYENDKQIMHISGWNYPVNPNNFPETVFLRGTSCWGWGTWDRAWGYFEKDARKLVDEFTKEEIYRFDYDGVATMWLQVEENLEGKLDTWAIFWYASVFKKNGLCLHPTKTMVRNIGHDGSGVHCGSSDIYDYKVANKPVSVFGNDLIESSKAMDEIKLFFKRNKKNLFQRIKRKIFRLIGVAN